MVHLLPVDSSAVDAAGYDAGRREMHVAYRGGRTYVYLGVAPETWEAFLRAESKGRFVNAEVKPKHRYVEG